MKKFDIFYGIIAIIALNTIVMLNAMDPAPKPSGKKVYTIDSVREQDPFRRLGFNTPATTEITHAHINSDIFPLAINVNLLKKMTLAEAKEMLDRRSRANPLLAQALNDPTKGAATRDEILQNMTQSNYSRPIPAVYLIDQKPGDIVMFEGKADVTNPRGIKIAEKEGNKIAENIVFSSQEKDPSFIESPLAEYAVTELFCKQANHYMNQYEKDLELREKYTSGKQKRIDDFRIANNIVEEPTVPEHRGNDFGFTSGWNGGKSLMNTEKRTLSSRPK